MYTNYIRELFSFEVHAVVLTESFKGVGYYRDTTYVLFMLTCK